MSSGTLTGTTSSPFDIQDQVVSCGQSSSCHTNVGTPSNGNNATFVASPGAPGLLIASVNANNGTQLGCAGYTSADTNTYESFLTSDRSNGITTTIKTPAIPLTGPPATTWVEVARVGRGRTRARERVEDDGRRADAAALLQPRTPGQPGPGELAG